MAAPLLLAFAPPLNPGPPPDPSEWRLTGWALSPSGRQLARTWAYDDATDPIVGVSGAVAVWDVATGKKLRTVTGVPGGLCDIEPGRDCARWLDEETLGIVFNTNAVGILSLQPAALPSGVGDPTGRDTGPTWGRFPSGRWVVGFPAAPTSPLSLWNPSAGTLAPYAPGQAVDEAGRRAPRSRWGGRSPPSGGSGKPLRRPHDRLGAPERETLRSRRGRLAPRPSR